MIHLVAAIASNGCIGKDHTMPWHCPQELQHFKQLTMGHTLIMGRTTWESIRHPLDGRTLWIATTDKTYQSGYEEVTVCHDLSALFAYYQTSDEILMVCGGAQLYRQALPYASDLQLSVMRQAYDGDTFFPEVSAECFQCIVTEPQQAYIYYHYKRRKEPLCDL